MHVHLFDYWVYIAIYILSAVHILNEFFLSTYNVLFISTKQFQNYFLQKALYCNVTCNLKALLYYKQKDALIV